MSDCDRFGDEILDSRSSTSLSAPLTTHLSTCLACRTLADQHFALFARMDAIKLAPSPAAWSAIAARIDAPTPSFFERLFSSWQVPTLALAAALFLVLLGGRSGLSYRAGGAFELAGTVQPAAGRIAPGATPCTLNADSWIELKTDGASLVRIEGPARFQVPAANELRLQSGRARFDLGPQPAGFSVRLEGGSVHVIGTRFTVNTTPEGAHVAVEHGTVEVRPTAGAARRLEAGGEAFLASTGALRDPAAPAPITPSAAPTTAPTPAPTRAARPPPDVPPTPASPPSIRAVRPGGRATGGF